MKNFKDQLDLLINVNADDISDEPKYKQINQKYFEQFTDDELRVLHTKLNNFPEIKHNDYSIRICDGVRRVIKNKNEFIGLESQEYPEIKHFIITHEIFNNGNMTNRAKQILNLINKEIIRRFFL